jgi:hypothetical protein
MKKRVTKKAPVKKKEIPKKDIVPKERKRLPWDYTGWNPNFDPSY